MIPWQQFFDEHTWTWYVGGHDRLRKFKTHKEVTAFNDQVYRQSGGVLESWSYHCPICHLWHTTGDFTLSSKLNSLYGMIRQITHVMDLSVTTNTSTTIYRNENANTARQVAIVRLGEKSIHYLYREEGEKNWYVYGYAIHTQNGFPAGDLREVLGEHEDMIEMAKRSLAYEGYIERSEIWESTW